MICTRFPYATSPTPPPPRTPPPPPMRAKTEDALHTWLAAHVVLLLMGSALTRYLNLDYIFAFISIGATGVFLICVSTLYLENPLSPPSPTPSSGALRRLLRRFVSTRRTSYPKKTGAKRGIFAACIASVAVTLCAGALVQTGIGVLTTQVIWGTLIIPLYAAVLIVRRLVLVLYGRLRRTPTAAPPSASRRRTRVGRFVSMFAISYHPKPLAMLFVIPLIGCLALATGNVGIGGSNDVIDGRGRVAAVVLGFAMTAWLAAASLAVTPSVASLNTDPQQPTPEPLLPAHFIMLPSLIVAIVTGALAAVATSLRGGLIDTASSALSSAHTQTWLYGCSATILGVAALYTYTTSAVLTVTRVGPLHAAIYFGAVGVAARVVVLSVTTYVTTSAATPLGVQWYNAAAAVVALVCFGSFIAVDRRRRRRRRRAEHVSAAAAVLDNLFGWQADTYEQLDDDDAASVASDATYDDGYGDDDTSVWARNRETESFRMSQREMSLIDTLSRASGASGVDAAESQDGDTRIDAAEMANLHRTLSQLSILTS